MEQLKKNEFYTAAVEAYSADGAGIARIGGQVVFVKGAIRGETCRIKILKVLKNHAYGKIEEILKASPARVTPACPVFGKCGGCDFMHMDYREELFLKKQRVQDALTRIGGLNIEVSEISGAEKLSHYRNKAIFAVGMKDGRPVAGFYRGRSHDIVPAQSCGIQASAAARAAEAVCRWMEKCGVPAYDEASGQGDLRHVFCRWGQKTGELQVTVVTAKKKLRGTESLIEEILRSCPETVSIVLNINETKGNTVLSGPCITLWGKPYITDMLMGLKFKLSPMSFYQVNRDQAEKLYQKVVEFAALSGEETVVDLYCGTGTITLCLAGRAKRVIGAEIVPAAVEDARENAEDNGISNGEFILGDAGEAAAEIRNRGIRPDVVVVDPPRKGLSPEVPSIIGEMAPERVVYVSCDPATLARDLKIFSGLGYTAARAEAVDMFPRCAHIETIVLLQRETL